MSEQPPAREGIVIRFLRVCAGLAGLAIWGVWTWYTLLAAFELLRHPGDDFLILIIGVPVMAGLFAIVMLTVAEWLIEQSRFFDGLGITGTVAKWYKERRGPPQEEEWEELPTEPGLDYRSYLQSDAWRQKREFMLQRAGYRCQVCNKKGRLELHHRTYERLGEERMEDLLVLCSSCHGLFHGHQD